MKQPVPPNPGLAPGNVCHQFMIVSAGTARRMLRADPDLIAWISSPHDIVVWSVGYASRTVNAVGADRLRGRLDETYKEALRAASCRER